MNILKHVDFLDLVDIVVVRIPNTGQFRVFVESIEKDQKVIFDSDALETMNNKITEICKNKKMSALDPNTRGYVEEFVGKMVSELAKNGLVVLEKIKDQPDDPYAKVRKEFEKI